MVTTELHHLDMQKPQAFSSEQFQQMECDLSDDLEESDAQSGTKYDKTDMHRMGKSQEMKRNIRFVAAISFSAVIQATWEFLIISDTQGLENGGLAGLFWSYVWNFFGFGFIYLSLAEMASMAPTAGGQYHWVSELAPPRYQKFLSYTVGWMSVLSWQAGTASGAFLSGTIIQGLISVQNPDYNAEAWQGTLLVFANILVTYAFNVYLSEWMHRLQNLMMVTHIFCWAVILIVLWTLSPRQPASAVFTQFTNDGGWSSMGLSLMVGQISALYGFLSSDGTAHMSEEVRDAGRFVPLAIVWGFAINGLLGIIMAITVLFATPSLNDALNDPTGFPIIYVFKQATSTAGVNGLTACILVPVILSTILFNVSTARQTFSFARDKGLPFSSWISKIDPKRKIPVNAIMLSCMIGALLSLINIGSSTAFNAIISLNVGSLMYSYTISIGCMIWRKLYRPHTLPPRRWSLGKYGLGINIVGLMYVMFGFFWSFWPGTTPVTLDTFNWSVVLFVGFLIISSTIYIFKGRHEYVGPVMDVKKA